MRSVNYPASHATGLSSTELGKSIGLSMPMERKKDIMLLPAKIAIRKSYLPPPLPLATITMLATIAKVNKAIQAASPPSEGQDMRQLLQLLVKHNMLQGAILSNSYESEDYNLPRYNIKHGHEIYDTASKELPISKSYNLNHSISLQYLKVLCHISDNYSYRSVLNRVEMLNRKRSILQNYHEITIKNATNKAKKCWEPDTIVTISDKALI